MPRRAEDGKRQDGQQHRVKPGDYRRADDLGIAHHLGNAHRGKGDASHDVRQNPGSVEREDALKQRQPWLG
jgi:hypothetical protein